jgi:ribonuclease HI
MTHPPSPPSLFGPELLPPTEKSPATSSKLPLAHAYTDGACSGNPGKGGWACLLKFGGKTEEHSGSSKHTTNNRMELQGAIEALTRLPSPHAVTLHTDSQYVVKGMTEWLPGWRKRGWKNAQGKPVENKELWENLSAAASRHQVTWQWVRGHNGHPENERVDTLAVAAYKNLKL